jgi:hypothetical protein
VSYLVKKGPADPFRGNWYVPEAEFSTQLEAIAKAASLALKSQRNLKNSWEEFGYEWSVFETDGNSETKIWEGYKYIKEIEAGGDVSNLDLGFISHL